MTEPKTSVIPYAEPVDPPKALSPAARTRWWCLLIGGLALVLLAVGWWLEPSSDGHGTHRQMGFPPCGMLVYTGLPCPTCGCTTAVSHVAHGHMLTGLITQPFGALVGYLAWIAMALAVISAVRGKWVGPSAFFFQWHAGKLIFAGILLLVGGWGYKILAMRWGW